MKIQCRGRNSWFIYKTNVLTELSDGTVAIEVFSKNYGKQAPICFSGNPEELFELLGGLSQRLKEIIKRCHPVSKKAGPEEHFTPEELVAHGLKLCHLEENQPAGLTYTGEELEEVLCGGHRRGC